MARPVDVYHINKVTQPGEVNYHKQHRLFISMTDTVKYIQKHDEDLMRIRGISMEDVLNDLPAAKMGETVPGTADTQTADGGQ